MGFLKFVPDTLKDSLKRRLRIPEATFRLENLKSAGFRPTKAVDCGAYKGDWSRTMKHLFPDISILMIEPQEEMASGLQALVEEHPGCLYRQAALGARSETKHFLSQNSNSRVVQESDLHLFDSEKVQIVETVTLDALLEDSAFAEGVDCLKIDSQGYEIEILQGATRLLDSVELVQLEISVIQIGPCPSSFEVMQYMNERGFLLYDIFDFNYRPLDAALWQVDCVFVRQDSPLVESREWA